MKIVTIINNNRITGVEYGVVEIGDNIQIKRHQSQYKMIKNQIRQRQRVLRIRQK
jgi:hypothetical protein